MADSPQHVAIIMDGNGRWARSRGMPRPAGHRASVKVVRKVVEECAQRKVRYLTLFAFSSENWRRPPDEVGMLMNLFLDALEREVADLHRNQVRLTLHRRPRVAGGRTRAPDAGRGRAHRGQFGTAADRRDGLRRPLGHRAGLPLARRRRGRRHAARRGHRRSAGGAAPRAGRHPGSRPSDPHRRGAARSAISCCGILPTPNSISATCCGPSLRRRTWTRPSSSSCSASAASARPRRNSRRKRMPETADA